MTLQQIPHERHPDYIRTILERAVTMIETGRLDSAEVLLATLGDEPSVKEVTAYLRGTIAARLEQNLVAQRFFKAAVEANPQNAEAHAQLGRLLLDEQPGSAAAAFAAALTLDARNPDWHVGLAKALGRLGFNDLAKESLADALSRSPGHAEASKIAALMNAETENAGEVEAASERRRSADESILYDALFMEATRRQSGGDVARAKTIFERLLKHAPAHDFALCNLGALERMIGNLDRSVELLEQAIASSPKLVPAHLALAETYLASDKTPAARARFEAAIELEPQNAGVYAAYAMALKRMGAFEEAIPHFHRAILIDQQQSAEFYAALGAALAALEMHDRAEVAFQHAAALAPDSIEAQRGLLQSTLALGRHDRAKAQIEAMLTRTPSDAEADALRQILQTIPA